MAVIPGRVSAPAVKPPRPRAECRRLQQHVGIGATLNALKRQGELAFDDIDLLTRMLDAMICKIALLLPEADDPKKLRKNGQKIIDGLLGAFRKG